jgi:predicted DNA binding CopG/RHH family protein
MSSKAKVKTYVVSFRVDKPSLDRIKLRALKKGIKVSAYLKDFIEKDLFRNG